MPPSSRRSRFAWIVLFSLLGAAIVAPFIEVGDLLEETLHQRLGSLGPEAPDRVGRRAGQGVGSQGNGEEFLVVGQYASLAPRGMPVLVLQPLARLSAPRPAPSSLSHAGRLHLDRGPPLPA